MENLGLLSADQVQSFEENGFLHVENVLSEQEIALLRADEERVTCPVMHTKLCSPDYFYATDPVSGKTVLHRVNHIQTKTDAFFKLFGSPQLLRIAESIHGPTALPGAMALVIKSPGYGVSVPWHRDPAFCRVRHGINLGVYLDDAEEENGMLYALPGSHKRADIDIQALIEEHGFLLPGAVPVRARAGDVIVHSENVFHGSRAVRSDKKRRVAYYGCRTIEEQMSRGMSAAWVQAVAKIFHRAMQVRAASDLGRGETPYTWSPGSDEYLPKLSEDDYVELRLAEC